MNTQKRTKSKKNKSKSIPISIILNNISKAIEETIPRDLYYESDADTDAVWWKDNDNAFQLARALIGIDGFETLSVEEERQVVFIWYEKYESLLTDREGYEFEFEEIYEQYLQAKAKVKFPKGKTMEGFEKRAAELLAQNKLPEIELVKVKRYRLLAAVCYLMQMQNTNKPFSITQGTAGDVIHRGAYGGNTALNYLMKVGILEFVKKGHPYSGGTQFWYKKLKT